MFRKVLPIVAAICIVAGSAGASWEQFHGDARNSGVASGDGFGLANMAAPRFVSSKVGLNAQSSPCVMGGKVFAYGNDKLIAFDKNNGSVKWSATVKDGSALWSWSSPSADKATNSVLIGSGDTVYCFNADNGSKRWEKQVGDIVNSSPLIVGGKVYIHADGGFGMSASFYALNISDGSTAWSAIAGGGAGSAKPVYQDGLVYSTIDFKMRAYEAATGNVVWTSPFDAGYAFFGGITYADDVLYAPTYNFSGDGTLVAVNALDGSLIWEKPTPSGDATPAVCGDLVLTSGDWMGPGTTTAHRLSDGSVEWTAALGGWAFSPTVIDLSPAPGDEYAVLTEQNGSKVALVDLATGGIAASYSGAGGGPAAIADGSIYLIGNDGALWSFGQPVPEPGSLMSLAGFLFLGGSMTRRRR